MTTTLTPPPGIIKRPSVRATDPQKARVTRVTVVNDTGHEGVYTGVAEEQRDGWLALRLYSAQCLHDVVWIDTEEIVGWENDPR